MASLSRVFGRSSGVTAQWEVSASAMVVFHSRSGPDRVSVNRRPFTHTETAPRESECDGWCNGNQALLHRICDSATGHSKPRRKTSVRARFHATCVCNFLLRKQQRGRIIGERVGVLHVPSFDSTVHPVPLYLVTSSLKTYSTRSWL